MNPENILLIRLSSLGDIVLATPVAQKLRRLYPRARLQWLLDYPYAELLENQPFLDGVFSYHYHGKHRGIGGAARLAGEIGRADLLVDLQHKTRTVMLAKLLKPARRLVLVKRNAWQLARALAGRDPVFEAPHQIERNLSVLGESGAGEIILPRLQPPAALAESLRRKFAPENSPLLAVVAGARHPTKCWPPQETMKLCVLAAAAGLRPVLVGGPEQRQLAEQLTREDRRLASHCEESLGGLSAMLSICRVALGPDSGPLHLAAALGVPTVALFGPTSPGRWAPRGSPGKVLRLELSCSPCSNHGSSHCRLGHHDCMRKLSAEKAWQAVQELLRGEKEAG